MVERHPLNEPLFSRDTVAELLEDRRRLAVSAVAQVPVDEIRFTPEQVVERLVAEHRVEPVSFDFAAVTRTEPAETTMTRRDYGQTISTPGYTMSFTIPFRGDSELVRRRASSSGGVPPHGYVFRNNVWFSIPIVGLTPEQVKQRVERVTAELAERIGWANADVNNWEPQLRESITATVNQRKQVLDQAAQLSAALDIPLTPTGADRQVTIPVTRQRLRLEPASAAAAGEPALHEAVFEDVLRTLSSLGRALERLPRTASQFSENELRDLALFVLNSNYEGAARGEVFNGNGKTDLLLPWADRNAFVGECKKWRSPRGITDALDQLLGYAVWRDTKAVLMLFIRHRDQTAIIDKADERIRAHPCCRAAVSPVDPSVRRDYLMHARTDPQRPIRLVFLPVVVPVPTLDA